MMTVTLLMTCLAFLYPKEMTEIKKNDQPTYKGNGRAIRTYMGMTFSIFPSFSFIYVYFCLHYPWVLTGGRALQQYRADLQVSLYIQTIGLDEF
jgi:hypothetical protein